MAMEYRHTMPDTHPKPVMCVQYNPLRREIYTAGEDSSIRVWEAESGKFLNSWSEHIGWISQLLYCKEYKVLFSCSVDGQLIAWSPNGKPLQKLQTGSPIYSLAYNARRQQLMAGQNKKVRLIQLTSDDVHGSEIMETKSVVCSEHADIVSSIVSCEGRFYSAGYDRKIIIYDVPHHGDLRIKVSTVVKDAHDAAISCMVYGKDADNSWLITGSFDRVVKLWSLDGNLMQRFDGFSDTITSICYVVPTQTLWVTASSSAPIVYDPRSGINVSDFVQTDDERFHRTGGSFSFRHLTYVPETNEVIGISTRRSLIFWRYNSVAPLTILPGHSDIVECLTFIKLDPLVQGMRLFRCFINCNTPNLFSYLASKEPLLIFSGGDDGVIRKWERLQLNTFMYSQDTLVLPKEETVDSNESESDISTRHGTGSSSNKKLVDRKKMKATFEKMMRHKVSLSHGKNHEEAMEKRRQVALLTNEGYKEYKRRNKSSRAAPPSPLHKETVPETTKPIIRPGILSITFYEDLDILVSGYEDSRICVWGYNEENIMPGMTAAAAAEADPQDGGNMTQQALAKDTVSNRVAGMGLKATLLDHKDSVTGLVCFQRDGVHWMISTGWDRRICVWDLANTKLHDVFRNSNQGIYSGKEELAADGIILSLEYAPERNEFAYTSSDKMAYIRKFSPNGLEMTLSAVLQGHEAEVTQIKWHRKHQQWITGSEDRTIRIWPGEGIPCLRVIHNDGPVTALCIDAINGCLITGSQDKVIRVFDIEKKDELVQKNIGHSDEIRCIIHIPVRNQYVSASWDNSVRIWNAYMKKGQRRIATKAANASNYYQNPIEEEEQKPLFSELNPLTVPKLLTKPVFAKEFALEKTQAKEDDYGVAAEKTALEEELRQTFNDLEAALNQNEKLATHTSRQNRKMARAAAGKRRSVLVPE